MELSAPVLTFSLSHVWEGILGNGEQKHSILMNLWQRRLWWESDRSGEDSTIRFVFQSLFQPQASELSSCCLTCIDLLLINARLVKGESTISQNVILDGPLCIMEMWVDRLGGINLSLLCAPGFLLSFCNQGLGRGESLWPTMIPFPLPIILCSHLKF